LDVVSRLMHKQPSAGGLPRFPPVKKRQSSISHFSLMSLPAATALLARHQFVVPAASGAPGHVGPLPVLCQPHTH
jgi:hypothetical protein